MEGENSQSKFIKLNDNNWTTWRFQLTVFANSKEATDALSTPLPDNADAATKKKYNTIYTFICITCSEQQQSFLLDIPLGDAFKAYQALSNIYEAKTSHSIFQLVTKVVSAKQNGQPPIQFTTAVSNDTTRLRNVIREGGHDIYDVLEASALLNGVDSSYATTVEALLVSGETKVLKIRNSILERGERLKGALASNDTTSALSVKTTTKPTKPCPVCLDKKGKAFYHWKEDCYLVHPEKKPPRTNRTNFNNGKHTFQGNKAETDDNNDDVVTAAWPAVAELDDIDKPTTSVYNVSTSVSNLLTLKIDSGAKGVDVFLSPDNIVGVHDIAPTNVKIAQLGKEPVIASHQGYIGNVQGAPLRVLTGANISTTLLSVDGLAKRNIGVYLPSDMNSGAVLFIDEKQLDNPASCFPSTSIVHRGYKKNGDYLVDITVDPTHKPDIFTAQSANAGGNSVAAHRGVNESTLSLQQRIYLLHCRLSHRSPEQLHELVEHHSVGAPVPKGTPLTAYQQATSNCAICPLSKMRGRPHARADDPIKRTKKPWQYTHLDIMTWGNPSYGGNKYSLNIVDDATNAYQSLPLKAKSDLTSALDTFHRRRVRPYGLKIDDVKLDRGGEQRSIDFERFCARESILPHYTSPGDSRANGKVERANLTISTDVIALRLQGNLSRKSWGELSRTATILHNHLPTSANPDKKSPQEMINEYFKVTQPKPDISKLRTIGTTCFAYIHPKNRREGDNKAVEGVLVGYTPDLSAYRVMIKGSSSIIESDHVEFHETVPGHDDIITIVRPTTSTPNDARQPSNPSASVPVHVPVPPQTQQSQLPADSNRLRVPARLAPFIDPELLAFADDIEAAEDIDDHQPAQAQGEQGQFQGEVQLAPAAAPPEHQQVPPARASGLPVWRSRRGDTRSQRGRDSLSSLSPTRSPTHEAHFTQVVIPQVQAYDSNIASFNRKMLYHDPTALVSQSLLSTLPYTEALKQPGAGRGMLRELLNVMDDKMDIIKRPDGIRPITSTWTHKKQSAWKLDDTAKSPENFELRSRLCPRGFQQQPGSYNPDSIEAPTPRPETVRTFHALSVNRHQKVVLIDEKSAFSNTPLDPSDEIYMKFPDGMINPNGEYCLKMNNSINGIKQAGNNYYRRTAKHLMETEHFNRSSKDPCYFSRWNDNRFIQVLAWVDDIRVGGDNDDDVDAFVKRFQEKYQCKISDGTDYLGTEVFYDRQGGVLTISVKKKVQDLLTRFGMADCRPVATPAVPNTVLERPEADAVKDPEVETFEYLSGVYSVYWLALTGKQEILHAVRDLSLHTSNYDASHVQAFKHLLRYLRGQLDNHLVLRSGTFGLIKTGTYADSDFAGSPERSLTPMRSTSGIVLFLSGIGLLLGICKGQPTIARSTAEAEYRSTGLAAVVVLDMNEFLEEIGFPQSEPTIIYQDNQACIKMTKSLVCGSKSRHIKIEHHYIRELVANKQVVLVYCPTSEMVADLLTKNLPKPTFEHLRNILYNLL